MCEFYVYRDCGYPREYHARNGDCCAVDFPALEWRDTAPIPFEGKLNAGGRPYRLHVNHALRVAGLHAENMTRVYTEPCFYSMQNLPR